MNNLININNVPRLLEVRPSTSSLSNVIYKDRVWFRTADPETVRQAYLQASANEKMAMGCFLRAWCSDTAAWKAVRDVIGTGEAAGIDDAYALSRWFEVPASQPFDLLRDDCLLLVQALVEQCRDDLLKGGKPLDPFAFRTQGMLSTMGFLPDVARKIAHAGVVFQCMSLASEGQISPDLRDAALGYLRFNLSDLEEWQLLNMSGLVLNQSASEASVVQVFDGSRSPDVMFTLNSRPEEASVHTAWSGSPFISPLGGMNFQPLLNDASKVKVEFPNASSFFSPQNSAHSTVRTEPGGVLMPTDVLPTDESAHPDWLPEVANFLKGRDMSLDEEWQLRFTDN